MIRRKVTLISPSSVTAYNTLLKHGKDGSRRMQGLLIIFLVSFVQLPIAPASHSSLHMHVYLCARGGTFSCG
jgi:hypothetical protein